MNTKKKLIVATDHRGFELKEYIKNEFSDIYEFIDVGTFTAGRTDYPEFAFKAVEEYQKDKSGNILGAILLCGSGIGMAIAANRFKGIYAGVAWNKEIAMAAKADDNVNFLVLPADFVEIKTALEIIDVWLKTQFKGDRYLERLKQIDR